VPNGVADVAISEAGYTGSFSVSSNTTPTVASGSIANSILQVNALAAGSTTITVADNHGNSTPCLVTVH
jgi:hypothetical protein